MRATDPHERASPPRSAQQTSRRTARLPAARHRIAALAIIALGWPVSGHAQGCGASGGAPAASACGDTHEAASLAPVAPSRAAGNPVDVVTGNKYLRIVDIAAVVDDRAADDTQHPRDAALSPLRLSFARHYNSRHAFARGLGAGWSHNWDTRVVVDPGRAPRVIQLLQADGARRLYHRHATAAGEPRWLPTDPTHGDIIAIPGPVPADETGAAAIATARWSWRWPSGRRLFFDAAGRLVAIRAPDGDALALHHDARHRLLGIVDRQGGAIALHYQGDRLRAVGASDGRAVVYGYDRHGRLSSARWFLPAAKGERRAVATQRLRYRDSRAWHLLTSVEWPDGRASHYGYDDQGRAVYTRMPGADEADALHLAYRLPASPNGIGLTRVRHRGGVARYHWRYDARAHRPMITAAEGDACAHCPPVGGRYRYDASSRLVAAGKQRLRRDPAGRIVAVRLDPGRASPASHAGSARIDYDAEPTGADGPRPWVAIAARDPSVRPGHRHRVHVRRDARGRPIEILEHGHTWGPAGRSARAVAANRVPLPRSRARQRQAGRHPAKRPPRATLPVRRAPAPRHGRVPRCSGWRGRRGCGVASGRAPSGHRPSGPRRRARRRATRVGRVATGVGRVAHADATTDAAGIARRATRAPRPRRRRGTGHAILVRRLRASGGRARPRAWRAPLPL
ncbi:MAG: DUF6531 domain-containing protein [Burkholderiaceae bacterium]